MDVARSSGGVRRIRLYKESGFRRYQKSSGILVGYRKGFGKYLEGTGRFRNVLEGSISGTNILYGGPHGPKGCSHHLGVPHHLGPHGPIRFRAKGEGVLLLVGLGVRPFFL